MKRLLLLLLLFLAMPLSMADGMYMGPPGFEPEIPNQRAVILYKNGIETLMVQSTLDAPKGEYSWVVPLPNEPTHYAAGTDTLFNTWEERTKPEVLYHVPWWLSMAPIFCGILLFGLALAPFSVETGKIAWRWLLVFGLLGLVVSRLNFSQPTEAATGVATKSADRSALGGEVEILESRDVGSYRVDVVRGRTSADLSRWLSANRTPLPPKADSIVQDYVAKGWVFMAVKLREHAGGLLEPHPLAVEFPSAEIVYPMRLTGLSSRILLLDLYVVTDGTVEMGPLKMWYSDRLSALHSVAGPATILDWSRLFPFKGNASMGSFGPDSVVTRLRGEIPPEEMDEDYVGKVGSPRSFHLTLFSRDYSQDASEGWAAWIALVSGLLVYLGMVRLKLAPAAIAASVLLTSAAAGALTYSYAVERFPAFEDSQVR